MSAYRFLGTGSVLIQPSIKISNHITSYWSDAYSRYFSRKVLPDFIPNVHSSTHCYSSTGKLLKVFFFIKLRSFTRDSAANSSRESIHMNVRLLEAVAWGIFKYWKVDIPIYRWLFFLVFIVLCHSSLLLSLHTHNPFQKGAQHIL